MARMLPWLPKDLGVFPSFVLATFLLSPELISAGERKYLPRLGPSPLRFIVPVELPVPFRLPPLDMGESEDEARAAKKANETKKNDQEAAKKPERRTRTTTISSRPIASSGSSGANSGSSSSVAAAGLQGSESRSSSSQTDMDSLIPDGFDIGFGGSASERRDLSVFLNYFVGQSQKQAAEEKSPLPPPVDKVVSP